MKKIIIFLIATIAVTALSGCSTAPPKRLVFDKVWEDLNMPMNSTELLPELDIYPESNIDYNKRLVENAEKVSVAFCDDEPLVLNDDTGRYVYYCSRFWKDDDLRHIASTLNYEVLKRLRAEEKRLEPVYYGSFYDIRENEYRKYVAGNINIIILDFTGSFISFYTSYVDDSNKMLVKVVTRDPSQSPVAVLRAVNQLPDFWPEKMEYKENIARPAEYKNKAEFKSYIAASKAKNAQKKSSSPESSFNWAGLASDLSRTVDEYYSEKDKVKTVKTPSKSPGKQAAGSLPPSSAAAETQTAGSLKNSSTGKTGETGTARSDSSGNLKALPRTVKSGKSQILGLIDKEEKFDFDFETAEFTKRSPQEGIRSVTAGVSGVYLYNAVVYSNVKWENEPGYNTSIAGADCYIALSNGKNRIYVKAGDFPNAGEGYMKNSSGEDAMFVKSFSGTDAVFFSKEESRAIREDIAYSDYRIVDLVISWER